MPDSANHEPANEVHFISAPGTRWSRVNAVESTPTVVKPLGADFFIAGTNASWRAMLENFGLVAPGEPLPKGGDAGYMHPVFGRLSLDIDVTVACMALFPGAHAVDHARELFSEDVAHAGGEGAHYDLAKYERYSAEVAAIVVAGERKVHDFWVDHAGPEGLRAGKDPVAAFNQAFDLYVEAQTHHSANSTLCQQYFSQAAKLAEEAGLGDLAPLLTTGIGDTFDTRSMARLWDVSRGEATFEQYLAEFGFQTSSGDDISAYSWREDDSALRALVKSYQRMDAAASPLAHEHVRIGQREEAEARILAALPEARRAAGRRLLDQLVHSTRVRELGKAYYRYAIDVGRAAARARGADLVATGRIDEANDIFFLTRAEGFDRASGDFRALVEKRKAINARYQSYDIPVAWTGVVEPTVIEEQSGDVTTVKGLGVSSGVVEGPVRLVLDHTSAEDMEPGEILVTNVTDPSWGPFFVVAGGLVIDIGGPMSHGAIIARELGIPCVINTGTGSRKLRDGMLVRVDGDTGEVTVLD